MSSASAIPRIVNSRGHGGRLRTEILQAATRLLAQHELRDSVTLRAIAREAGIAAPSIYPHFADRDAILDEVVASTFRALGSACADAAAGASTGRDQVYAISGAYLEFARRNSGQYRILFERSPANITSPPHPYRDGLDAFALMERAIERAAREAGCDSVDAARDAQCIWAALHGLAWLVPATPGFPWQAQTDLLSRIVTSLVPMPPGPTGSSARQPVR